MRVDQLSQEVEAYENRIYSLKRGLELASKRAAIEAERFMNFAHENSDEGDGLEKFLDAREKVNAARSRQYDTTLLLNNLETLTKDLLNDPDAEPLEAKIENV